MPTILALDTSTDACSVAVATEQGIHEHFVLVAREHTQRILPMVEAIFLENKLSLQELSAIAFGRGPGSFTGLRICLSVAQGLAYGADLPLIGVSSLESMAQQVLRLHKPEQDTVIVPILDARMDEVYWCAFKVTVAGDLEALVAEQVVTPELCVQSINQLQPNSIIGVGSGWHYQQLQNISCLNRQLECYPSAYDVATLALSAFSRGEFIKPQDAQPTYLRNEITWQKRQRLRSK